MSLWQIFTTMVLAGLAGVGGGLGVMAVARAEWVGPGLLSPEQFAWAYALGYITPGPVMVLVAALGYQLAGPGGVLAAVSGSLLPTWVIGVAAARAMAAARRFLHPLRRSVIWVLVGLMLSTGLLLARDLRLSPWELAGALGAAAAVGSRRVDPVWVLGAAAAIALAARFI